MTNGHTHDDGRAHDQTGMPTTMATPRATPKRPR